MTDLDKAEAYIRDAVEDLFRGELLEEILKGITKSFRELRTSGKRPRKAVLQGVQGVIDQALEVAAEQLIGDDKEAATRTKEASIDLLLARGYLRRIGRKVAS